MSKCVEVQWAIAQSRSNKFIELWTPYTEAAIDFGASGYALFRSLDDNLIVRQHAYFEDKLDWERYWTSDRLCEGRERALGLFVVPIIYAWNEVITSGTVGVPTPTA